MSHAAKTKCPYCNKTKKDMGLHIRMSHPDKLNEMSGTPAGVEATKPTGKTLLAVKMRQVSWWKLALGIVFGALGIFGLVRYASTINILWGFIAICGIIPSAFFIYFGLFKFKEGGYKYVLPGVPEFTGEENSLVIYSQWDSANKVAVPEYITFEYIPEDRIPTGSRMHLVRNLKKHFYELYNVINEETGEVLETRKVKDAKDGQEKEIRIRALSPVRIPDIVSLSTKEYKETAVMQPVKDYFDYNPGTNVQKIATGVLILAIVIVGILMTMTSGTPDSKPKNQPVVKYGAVVTEVQYDFRY